MIHDIDFLKRTMNDVPSILNMNERLLIKFKVKTSFNYMALVWWGLRPNKVTLKEFFFFIPFFFFYFCLFFANTYLALLCMLIAVGCLRVIQ